jgi:hypothetical protein
LPIFGVAPDYQQRSRGSRTYQQYSNRGKLPVINRIIRHFLSLSLSLACFSWKSAEGQFPIRSR